jgi:lauroyl/myristoyl acyltransferase
LFFRRKEKRTIRNAVRSVFEKQKSKKEIRKIVKSVYNGIIAHYFEKLFNAYSTSNTLRAFYDTHVACSNLDLIRRELAKGKGALLITGHYGGVELIPGYLGVNQLPVSIIAKFKTKHLREQLMRKSPEFSTHIIDPTQTPNVITEICSCLKENRVVITQCDEIEEWRPSNKEKMVFLGKLIWTDKTMNLLIRRTKASVLFGLMQRSREKGYEFVLNSMEDMIQSFRVKANSSEGEALLATLEHYIYARPDEWYQWKKYFNMETVPLSQAPEEKLVPVPLLQSSFSKT